MECGPRMWHCCMSEHWSRLKALMRVSRECPKAERNEEGHNKGVQTDFHERAWLACETKAMPRKGRLDWTEGQRDRGTEGQRQKGQTRWNGS